MAGHGAYGGLVARINVGALVAIYFYRDVMLVDYCGQLGIFVALAIDYVAPVAPDGADIEKNGLAFGAGASESGVAPFVPSDRLMRGGAEIGANGILQAVACWIHAMSRSLDGIFVAGVARIDGLASGEAFILAMIEADAIFAEAPAEIDGFTVDACWEI